MDPFISTAMEKGGEGGGKGRCLGKRGNIAAFFQEGGRKRGGGEV